MSAQPVLAALDGTLKLIADFGDEQLPPDRIASLALSMAVVSSGGAAG